MFHNTSLMYEQQSSKVAAATVDKDPVLSHEVLWIHACFSLTLSSCCMSWSLPSKNAIKVWFMQYYVAIPESKNYQPLNHVTLKRDKYSDPITLFIYFFA